MFFKVRYGFSKSLILIKRVQKKLMTIKKKHEVHSTIPFPTKSILWPVVFTRSSASPRVKI